MQKYISCNQTTIIVNEAKTIYRRIFRHLEGITLNNFEHLENT